MNLPKVNDEIFIGIIASMNHNPNFTEEMIEKIQEENPVIGKLMREVSEVGDKHPDFVKGYLRGAFDVYLALDRQTECNLLAQGEGEEGENG